jgi:glycosyltransferase involved in cell wall biosynthesis
MNKTEGVEYTASDISFVIPTRDRPEKLLATLIALAEQAVPCGKVIVAASGSDISEVILPFEGQLNVEYVHCDEPGQIAQRNRGLALLDANVRLVGFLDDDILLAPDALGNIVSFWNHVEPNTAGISFNVVKKDGRRLPLWRRTAEKLVPPGRVFMSGFSAPTEALDVSVRSARLRGGATIWRKAVLDEFKQDEIRASWAICEDLIFSYPISKKYPLYYCAEARVLHDHEISRSGNGSDHFTRGETWALWQLYFVTLNRDLSVAAYALTVAGISSLGMIMGLLIPSRRSYRWFFLGAFRGALRGLARVLRQQDLMPLLEEHHSATSTRTGSTDK